MDQLSSSLAQDRLEAEAFVEMSGASADVAAKDYINGLRKWKLWLHMAYADIRRRYRRTMIGPFWTTLSMAIFITSMGFIFSALWHTDMKTYLPYFASGYIAWMFISTIFTESCTTFVAAESYMKQIALPYSVYAFLIVARNVMIFLHQVVIFVVLMLIYHVPINHNTWMLIPGFMFLILNASWITIALGLICARFRDAQQIVISLLQIAMFVTPIFWSESQLGHGKLAFYLINFNPMYHLLSVLRYPLLGQSVHHSTWIANSLLLVVGWWLTMHYLAKNYNKLIYWL
jgi:lipopolysaccharide transport system permease protein